MKPPLPEGAFFILISRRRGAAKRAGQCRAGGRDGDVSLVGPGVCPVGKYETGVRSRSGSRSTMFLSGRAGVFIARAGDGRQKHAGRKADSAESLSAGIRPEEKNAFPSAERREEPFLSPAVPLRNTLFARSDGCIGAGRRGWRHDAKLNEGVLSGRAGGVFPTSSTMLLSGIRAGVFIVRAGDGRQKHAGRKADPAERLFIGIRPEERSAFPSAERRRRDRFCLRPALERKRFLHVQTDVSGQGSRMEARRCAERGGIPSGAGQSCGEFFLRRFSGRERLSDAEGAS